MCVCFLRASFRATSDQMDRLNWELVVLIWFDIHSYFSRTTCLPMALYFGAVLEIQWFGDLEWITRAGRDRGQG
jgi:hypothetical protein